MFLKLIALLQLMIMMTGCATNTGLSNACVVFDPQKDLTIIGLRKYDCICADKPENHNCN